MKKKHFIISMLVISLIGLLTSSYLAYGHYHPSPGEGICDLTASISCTILNLGIYSSIAGIPVALYGVIWFLILGILSLSSFKNKNAVPKLLVWGVVGFLFVLYFVYIELLLSTICPLCTFIHLLVIASLVLSISFYRQFYKLDLLSLAEGSNFDEEEKDTEEISKEFS